MGFTKSGCRKEQQRDTLRVLRGETASERMSSSSGNNEGNGLPLAAPMSCVWRGAGNSRLGSVAGARRQKAQPWLNASLSFIENLSFGNTVSENQHKFSISTGKLEYMLFPGMCAFVDSSVLGISLGNPFTQINPSGVQVKCRAPAKNRASCSWYDRR